MRRLAFAAVAGFVALASGCSKSSDEATNPAAERIIFSDGTRLHLATFDGTNLVTISTAQIPPAGLRADHMIFGIMKHPTKPWLYVSSFVNRYWGNARIDRFVVSKNTISWAAQEFDFSETVSTVDPCLTDYNSGGINNYCAPVAGTFSANGSRLYMKNDDYDLLEIFELDPDGALSLVNVSDTSTVYLHGVAVDPSGVNTYVYNGNTVFGVKGDVAQLVTTGDGGSYTRYFKSPAGPRILTVQDSQADSLAQVAIYDVSDPTDPVLVSSVDTLGNEARSAVLNDAMNRVVVGGQNSIRTYGWNGVALTPEASFDPHVGSTTIEGRSVAFARGGKNALMSYFIRDVAAPGGWSGGVSVYGIDPDGAITTVGTLPLPGASRVVQSLKL